MSDLTLVSFAAVDNAGRLELAEDPFDYWKADYSCGLFEFGKPHTTATTPAVQGRTRAIE